MVSPPEGTEQCTEYIETCSPPGYWKTSLPQLWKEPDIDTVMNALDSLDGTSAPGMDGIPAILYQTFAAHFAPWVLQVIRNVRDAGIVPEEWSGGHHEVYPQGGGKLEGGYAETHNSAQHQVQVGDDDTQNGATGLGVGVIELKYVVL